MGASSRRPPGGEPNPSNSRTPGASGGVQAAADRPGGGTRGSGNPNNPRASGGMQVARGRREGVGGVGGGGGGARVLSTEAQPYKHGLSKINPTGWKTRPEAEGKRPTSSAGLVSNVFGTGPLEIALRDTRTATAIRHIEIAPMKRHACWCTPPQENKSVLSRGEAFSRDSERFF